MAITANQLAAIMPRTKDPQGWAEALNNAMPRYDINTPERIAAFLAQLAHESAELNRLTENLNYSAKGLRRTWPSRFKTDAKANQFHRKPEKIANHVYANRIGNGNEASGDGWRYRGRGLIQLTGRGNYRSTGRAIGHPLEQNPELAARPDIAALVAAQFWQSRGLNELADDRTDDDDSADFVKISVIINGGRNGLAHRQAYWKKAKAALGTSAAPKPSRPTKKATKKAQPKKPAPKKPKAKKPAKKKGPPKLTGAGLF